MYACGDRTTSQIRLGRFELPRSNANCTYIAPVFQFLSRATIQSQTHPRRLGFHPEFSLHRLHVALASASNQISCRILRIPPSWTSVFRQRLRDRHVRLLAADSQRQILALFGAKFAEINCLGCCLGSHLHRCPVSAARRFSPAYLLECYFSIYQPLLHFLRIF